MALDLSNESRARQRTEPVSLRLDRVLVQSPGPRERMFFTEQLALMLETGTQLHAALCTLRGQTGNSQMSRVLDQLALDVEEGQLFSSALRRHPNLFNSTYTNLIAAAEQGGFLGTVLSELLRMDEKREELRRSLVSALSYPIVLVLFSIAVVVLVLVVVFPKFADMFEGIRDQLPWTTLSLMAASDILVHSWEWLLLSVALSAAGAWWWTRQERGKQWLDGVKLKMPGIRGVFVELYLVQSLRVMGLSLANGVSVMDTLAACREVVPNSVFRTFMGRVESSVQEGGGLAAAFRSTEFVPETVHQMLTTGEESGHLPRVMQRVADHYERELQRRLSGFARMIEPVMLLVMGGVVGLIVTALILPIFKLSTAVG